LIPSGTAEKGRGNTRHAPTREGGNVVDTVIKKSKTEKKRGS